MTKRKHREVKSLANITWLANSGIKTCVIEQPTRCFCCIIVAQLWLWSHTGLHGNPGFAIYLMTWFELLWTSVSSSWTRDCNIQGSQGFTEDHGRSRTGRSCFRVSSQRRQLILLLLLFLLYTFIHPIQLALKLSRAVISLTSLTSLPFCLYRSSFWQTDSLGCPLGRDGNRMGRRGHLWLIAPFPPPWTSRAANQDKITMQPQLLRHAWFHMLVPLLNLTSPLEGS